MASYFVRNVLFILFAVSGFTGLIYESIWSHYLKLFLGHAAYSQALVLAIFMGSMASGAWLTSNLASKWTNLLIIYAIVEGIIGMAGIFFHPVFDFILNTSFNNIIPLLDSPYIQIYKWTVSALLIAPQSILLGMTFPLMSNGIIRMCPDSQGKSLSILYFTNSLGAAIGVLVSGFVLISASGLPGTILIAGIINLILAIIVYGLARENTVIIKPETRPLYFSSISLLLLIAAFVTGLASFIYEIAWIRMLSMVLGASTHSFELMLSAFISGLALGGLCIRRRIDNLSDPLLAAGIIQIIMGLCALATVPLYNHVFDIMSYFMSALQRTDSGYNLFSLACHFISMLIMLPTTFFAGMTLPLFTNILLQSGHGERSIGQIYASNTLGAIIGVVFTIFIAMPLLGLKNTMLFGSALDVLLGVTLFMYTTTTIRKSAITSLAAFLLIIYSGSLFVDFDFRRMSSSVYRFGTAKKGDQYNLLFHKDGKTSTVHVISRPGGYITISTNGKPDANLNMSDNGKPGPDEPTMIMLAALPLAINPEIKTVANIGMGSGLTTHTLLLWPIVERVDTIEIESAMIEGANYFRPKVELAFTDPRSHIHIEDAKTYFANSKNKYDLITSEPSNPWVSGISSLFTNEFYKQIKKYLTENGIFVQWLQSYEINMQLVSSILKSLDNNFKYYNLFAATDGDLIIVASDNSPINTPRPDIFDNNNFRNSLSVVGINSLEDLKTHFLANERLVRPLLKLYDIQKNSDYFPILDLNATRSRFKQDDAYELAKLRLDPVPLINMLVPEYENITASNISEGYLFSTSKSKHIAREIYNYIVTRIPDNDTVNHSHLELLLRLSHDCSPSSDFDLWMQELISLFQMTESHLSPAELEIILDKLTPPCPEKLDTIQTQWLILLNALGQRNAEVITNTAITLLKNNDPVILEQKKFLLASLMLGLIKQGDNRAVIYLWENNVEKLFGAEQIPASFLIIYGLALEGYYNAGL